MSRRGAVSSTFGVAWGVCVITPRICFGSGVATIDLSAIETYGLRCLSDNRERHFFAIANQHFHAKDRNGPTIVMLFD